MLIRKYPSAKTWGERKSRENFIEALFSKENPREENVQAKIFMNDLFVAGSKYLGIENFEINRKLIEPVDLYELRDYARGALNRLYDGNAFYGLSLEFGCPEETSMSEFPVTSNTELLEYAVSEIPEKKRRAKNFKYIDAWIDLIVEGEEISQKMINLLPYVHDFTNEFVIKINKKLMRLMLFGFFLPLISFVIKLPLFLLIILKYLSLIALIYYIAAILLDIMKELGSSKLEV
ncbi:hypothetical protein EHQ53_15140 [Leptospira langatensis]|uniref:Uncharacterized protein n=1 Tax=Leptospira langatensis TaxID=2484983 RepID=A0A5F1ZQ00_9LEPT|nr:hypothetical protein [Leptospira langatensis]TGK01808.1 hypothetical protein EHO57_08380 [Leptospira langatensis]TGL39414.1 hypothetical protein EHQ53_15140 [Leptospira langatensis]